MVEFTLVLTFLVLVIMGIVDLGRGIYYYNVASASAREAARQSIICGSGSSTPTNCSSQDAATITAVINNTTAGVPLTSSNFQITPSSRGYGDTITARVTITFTPVTPLIARYLGAGGGIVLRAQSVMTDGN